MNDWTLAEDRPGYRKKTLRHGNATIVVYRPILTKEEQTKREQEVLTVLETAMKTYIRRKEQTA